MKLKDLILETRSFRTFKPNVKIGGETLTEWVKYAGLTASTMNVQALKFKICDSDEEIKKILSLVRFGSAIKDRTLPPKSHEPSAFIVICIDEALTDMPTLYFKDTGIAAQTIMLQARESGFGGCMIGSGDKELLKKELGLPENVMISLILALGEPDEQVELCEMQDSVTYFRDENNTHFVPKRKTEDIIIK